MMRFLAVVLGVLLFMLPGVAQQNQNNEAPKKAEKEQKPKKEEQAAKKPAETPSPAEQPKPEPAKDSGDDKEIKYDVTEVAPIVTHHQLTVDGSVMKYTATTGRLPIKRSDGK